MPFKEPIVVESAQLIVRPVEEGDLQALLEVNGDDEATRHALRHLGEIAEFVKVLGIYPAAKTRSR